MIYMQKYDTVFFTKAFVSWLTSSAACLCLVAAVVRFSQEFSSKPLKPLSRIFERLLFLCLASVNSSNHYTKANMVVISPVFPTNCCVKSCENFIKGLRFILSNPFT